MSNKSNSTEKKKKRKVAIIIGIIVLIILLLLLLRCCGKEEATSKGNVILGVIDVPLGDAQEKVDHELAEGVFEVFISTHMFVNKDGSFYPLIQNSIDNTYSCFVSIEDEGKEVWRSEVIAPGYKLEEDTIHVPLAQGKHDCIAIFHILEGTKEINTINVNISLVQRKT